MGPGEYVYRAVASGRQELQLQLDPGYILTWDQWSDVLSDLGHFMTEYEYVELDFDVLYVGAGMIATGFIELEDQRRLRNRTALIHYGSK